MRFVWALTTFFLLAGCSSGPQSKEETQIFAQLTKYENADPASDLQKAWAKGDFRFIGIYGIGLDTPGVPFGNDGGLIHLVGVNLVEGTSDFIQSNAQGKLVGIASKYARKYNLALFQRLKVSKNNDPRIILLFDHLEKELQSLEKSNPKIDLNRNIVKKDFAFIYLQETGIEGASDRDFDKITDYQLKTRDLKSSKDLLTKGQYQRYRCIAVSYVRPYNQMLFDYLLNRNKKQK